jgi:phosphatidylglycerophosphate synthase
VSDQGPVVIAVGDNPTRIWGMTNAERIRRIAEKQGLAVDGGGDGPRLLVNAAFAFDPPLLRYMAERPGSVLMKDGQVAMANVASAGAADEVADAMRAGAPAPGTLQLDRADHGEGFTLYNDELRKREQPFLMRLDPVNVRKIERASYFGAYKGVTDLLTKYLWPEWALALTRIAARLGISPNAVTLFGATLCLVALWMFWEGRYWEGLAVGLVFMVLDTVDGKLARCTITSSKLGDALDHGVDLIHPPFWYWAWIEGLRHVGLPLGQTEYLLVMGVIIVAYVLQRVIEGAFISAFSIHIHVWQPFDSRFRLITARRNPNMLILFVAVAAARPDIGIVAVAWWTAISLLVHLVRLGQALRLRARGAEVRSWLQP